MQLKFEGQTHTIDATTLVNSLTHYQTIVMEANKILSGGSREIKIQINAIEKGSFVIDVSLVQNIVEQLFSKNTIEYIADVCCIAEFAYNVYKLFKGKPIKSEEDKRKLADNITINNNVTINNVIHIYNQPLIREAISKTIETANEDSSVEGFTIINGNDKVAYERKDFPDYIYNDFDLEDDIPNERVIEKDAILVIIGLNFNPNSRWTFMYDGFKIALNVKDDALMEAINKGERFGKGDSIRVRLKITQTYNKEYNAYANKSFKIVEFMEHIIAKRPLPLDFEE